MALDYRRSPGLPPKTFVPSAMPKLLQPKRAGAKAVNQRGNADDNSWDVLVTSADIRALQAARQDTGNDDQLSSEASVKTDVTAASSVVEEASSRTKRRPTSAKPAASPGAEDSNWGMQQAGYALSEGLGSEASGVEEPAAGVARAGRGRGGRNGHRGPREDVLQGPGDVDELTLLSQDTPLAKLRAKEEEVAREIAQGGDGWRVLRLQQDVLSLAKLHVLLHRQTDHRPLLLPTAHYQLAQRYSALGCSAQASEHLQRSIDELPTHGQSRQDVRQLKRNVNICMAEALMKSDPPKAQVALQHLLAAAGQDSIEDVQEVDVVVLMSQAYVALAEAKLHEARGTRLAQNRLAIVLEELSVNMRKAELNKRMLEMASLRQRYSDTQNEANAESEYEARLVEQALEYLETASDAIIRMVEQQDKLFQDLGQDRDLARKDPLMQQLMRQGNSISLKESECHGLSGNTVEQERALREILSSHVVYGCVPVAMLARVRKELGAAFVKNKKYPEALECYSELDQLQRERYSEEYAQQELAIAECYKLSGDVFVASREFERAREHFRLAYDKYMMELGPSHSLVLDLEHRLGELDNYDDAHALASAEQ